MLHAVLSVLAEVAHPHTLEPWKAAPDPQVDEYRAPYRSHRDGPLKRSRIDNALRTRLVRLHQLGR